MVNTNAEAPSDFFLYRNHFDKTISYSDKIIWTGTAYNDEGKEVYHSASISLISGLYNLTYRDKLFGEENDTQLYSAIGKCSGLVPVLSYLENNNGSYPKNKNGSFLKNILKMLN